ncbi:MAG TPA: ABC transporter permease [Gemmatimonadaceae bacterium]|nr:ABC transporter permease [Gemmatimonadaceae bacterium]
MRYYSALLHLFPASFRLEYGREMSAIQGARLREATDPSERLKLWVETTIDMIMNASRVHWDVFRQDLRYSLRTLARSPGFALTAILVTGLGIGANTAAFSVADFVLIRPLPYRDADQLVKIWEGPADNSGNGRNEVSPALFQDWKTNTRSFASMGAYYNKSVNLVGQGDPLRLETAVVTNELLPILGVQPLKGRMFGQSETGDASSVILSYSLWKSAFGGDESIVGRKLIIDGSPRAVVGVMPQDFHYPSRNVALWMPMTTQEMSDPDITNTYWYVLARLRPGVTHDRANAEMHGIATRLRQQHPAELEETGFAVDRLRDEFSRQSRLLLLALCGAAGCVLLIACANLANLLLARALVRRRELLVRSALGAGRERLVRQSVTESFVLAILGGVVGVGIAYVSLPLLTRLVPTTLPIAQSPTIDPKIIVFAGLLTLITGVGFGVLPAWRSSGKLDLGGLRDGARAGGGRREHARTALVIGEVMASVVLLISAGLLMRALLHLQDTDPGFRTANVLTLRTDLPSPKYDRTVRKAEFYDAVLSQVRAINGVSSAAYTTGLPMVMTGGIWKVVPEGQTPQPGTAASSRFVTPDYFKTMSIPLRSGRDVRDDDDMNKPLAAVVSESFVKEFLSGREPIGSRFNFNSLKLSVIGVVGDVKVRGVEQTSEPQVYMPYKQYPDSQGLFYSPKDLVIRSSLPAATLVPAIRQIVHRVDPEQPISNIKPLAEVRSDATAARSVQVRVLVAFAAIAFILAAIGIHGLLSFSVSSRQHEIGVRMALGAQREDIVRMIMGQAAILAAAGVIPGLLIAYAAGRSMQSLLAGVQPADAVTFIAAGALCVIMTLVGSLLPTMRAVRVDPATAFRADV